ncbi:MULTISPECIES: hypothetical protein [Acidithiobacillus]|jgi:hypothetical protein|uniref:Uncharacterized protein n=3 Tax=Acidithiobacillus caldus TaxID=33059 RepID=F9ZS64_ACICS|nr:MULTISPECIES: hypothetical protein [Acidithiobacillus]AEK58984.1 conserved hypothetical protein [Acidithiobacillus caldus SM-1]AIA56033.1 hypothetical protein Acaty_c2179 [Acidithiobacillus caldus ATCC 51756]AUW33385.1 hypothetical protein A5904_11130 [Acidithiobacillus caldus]MBU2730704.1 hypothetical protein [Acidithiobacillus caldus]MBU2736146.1 hypothetical protein [Acidithiobacillus caldus ATCC 51756]
MASIGDRLRKRFLWMSSDEALRAQAQARLLPGWEMECGVDLEDFGDWQEILLRRFLVLDLDDAAIADPIATIDTLRREYQLNIPVFCFGGDNERRLEARQARADRFFARDEIADRLEDFQKQFGW